MMKDQKDRIIKQNSMLVRHHNLKNENLENNTKLRCAGLSMHPNAPTSNNLGKRNGS